MICFGRILRPLSRRGGRTWTGGGSGCPRVGAAASGSVPSTSFSTNTPFSTSSGGTRPSSRALVSARARASPQSSRRRGTTSRRTSRPRAAASSWTTSTSTRSCARCRRRTSGSSRRTRSSPSRRRRSTCSTMAPRPRTMSTVHLIAMRVTATSGGTTGTRSGATRSCSRRRGALLGRMWLPASGSLRSPASRSSGSLQGAEERLCQYAAASGNTPCGHVQSSAREAWQDAPCSFALRGPFIAGH
mmetsp:Transcript_53897/g.131761  ORF Transcript_53897/g.131761 Transcript_53897/m.131761 type:complete len:245 (+) Transcript_53897:1472-2206(+)